jgi:cytochrome oxidase assembly protein ShyY1
VVVVLRTALRPRWLALLALVLAAATAMSLLGQWQFDRARDRGRAQRAAALQTSPPVLLTDVLAPRRMFPGSAADAHVVAAGRWDGARQVLVPGRRLAGQPDPGMWVLTPLVLADGSAVGVVRGWVRGPGDPAAIAPSGQVRVTGVLRPAEPPVERAPGEVSGLPAGQVERVDVTDLMGRWPYRLFTGYVVATEMAPPPAPAPHAVPPLPERGGLAWRNASYALQWWVFAGFGLFLWWRMVRDAARPPSAPSPTDPAAGPGETRTLVTQDEQGAHP